MERLKNTGLKKSFVLMSVLGAATALFLIIGVFLICAQITARYPRGGMLITTDGVVWQEESPTAAQKRVLQAVEWVQILSCVLIPAVTLSVASLLFYRWKLKEPITVLQKGTERIRAHDLAFSIPEVSADELGQVCAAFEMMRAEMLRTNQELWRQAEERKRLNAAFSHDLRNPITVLKGTVKLLRQGAADENALERMEVYVLRLEQYVESMSSIQRLEQLPIRRKKVKLSQLWDEAAETARLLADEAMVEVSEEMREQMREQESGVELDHGLFLTVAENLIGNAVRYARSRIKLDLSICADMQFSGNAMDERGEADEQRSLETKMNNRQFLLLTVADDGCGYPMKLIQEGPKPFGRMEEDAAHFGMGLYTSRMLCIKHGGTLSLENDISGGARARAFFRIS